MEQNGVGSDDVERLAEHLWRAAALGVGERAATALARAADVAVGRVAYRSAEVLIRRAVQLREGAGTSTQALERLLAYAVLLRVMVAAQADREVVVRLLRDARSGSRANVRNLDGSAGAVRHATLMRAHEVAVRLTAPAG